MNQFIHSIFYDERGKLKPGAGSDILFFRCVAPFTLLGYTFPAGEIWECNRDYLRFCCDYGIIKLEIEKAVGVYQAVEIDYKIFSECFELIQTGNRMSRP